MLRLGELLQKSRRGRAAREQLPRLGLRREERRLSVDLVLHLVAQQLGDVDEAIDLLIDRIGEPSIETMAENEKAEEHEKEDRHAGDGESADHELGANARARLVGLARDVQLDQLAEQHEPERHHQDEDEDRGGPEDERLADIGRAEMAEAKRALPHDERHRERQQQCADCD